MLIISRKKDQKIVVAEDIEITILEVGRNRVRFGIKAPKEIAIHTRLKDTPAIGEAAELKSEERKPQEHKPEERKPFAEPLRAAVGVSKRT